MALRSVLQQNLIPDEVIVVDDGSNPENLAMVRDLVSILDYPVKLVELARIKGGHGPAYSRNAGVAASHSSYICFLDDDDTWIYDDYILTLQKIIDNEDEAEKFDLHFCHQTAFDGDVEILRPIWVAELSAIVRGRDCGPSGEYNISIDDLLQCTGFCHLNTTCVRKEFFHSIRGFNEEIRYESDRDFFFRAIDKANFIKYSSIVVARHNIPDRLLGNNVSTSMSKYNRWIFQLCILEKIAIESQHPELRAYGRLHKSYTMKKIARGLFGDGQYESAWIQARTALLAGFTIRWALFSTIVGGSAVLLRIF